ncbi:phosphatidate cytidylyltransferase [bacterium]|nr:phosphatidate cytidylyltransferase [bacterium]
MFQLWSEPLFIAVASLTVSVIFGMTLVYYFLQRRQDHFRSSFSTVVSWLLITPFLFIFLGMNWPFPLILVTIISIYGAKIFFQMTGMYHRSYFVIACYLALIACGTFIYLGYNRLFEMMPPLFFFAVCLIPMIRNNYKQMVQYIALTLVNFLLLWFFMHLSRIMALKDGIYIAIYIIMLTEAFENIYLRVSRHFKKIKIVSELTPKRSLEGYLAASLLTLGLGYLSKNLLSVDLQENWWMIATACFVFGSTGDTILVVIRRDLGIKIYSSFVIGRGDFFTRIERLVFVAPASYYVISYLQGTL